MNYRNKVCFIFAMSLEAKFETWDLTLSPCDFHHFINFNSKYGLFTLLQFFFYTTHGDLSSDRNCIPPAFICDATSIKQIFVFMLKRFTGVLYFSTDVRHIATIMHRVCIVLSLMAECDHIHAFVHRFLAFCENSLSLKKCDDNFSLQ